MLSERQQRTRKRIGAHVDRGLKHQATAQLVARKTGSEPPVHKPPGGLFITQFGSLDEVVGLCERVDLTVPNVDWAHLHARDRGRFKSADDFRRVLDEVERRLGSGVLKNLYCHFSHIEFTERGEKRHVDLDVAGFGPDFGLLAGLFVELGLNPVVCCETPSLDVDAQKLRDILYEELKRKGGKINSVLA